MKLSYRDIVFIGKVLAAIFLSLLLWIPVLLCLAMFMAIIGVTLGGWFGSDEELIALITPVLWTCAGVASFAIACRLVFYGFEETYRTRKFDLVAASIAGWLAKVGGYMFFFYFFIAAVTTLPAYDADAPEEVRTAVFDAAREKYRLHYLLAFIASAVVSWFEIRKMNQEIDEE